MALLLGDLILPLYNELAKILLCTKQYGSKKATVVILWCQPSKETKLVLGRMVLSFTIYVKHVKRKELILKFRKQKFVGICSLLCGQILINGSFNLRPKSDQSEFLWRDQS